VTALADARGEISTAVNATADLALRCTPNYRQLTRPGDAMVRLDHLNRDVTGFGFMATFQVLIALHQDLPTAEAWIDTHTEDLIAAVAAALVVTDVSPVELVTDANKIPALQITGTRAI
jgi:hypothetical protein